MVDAVGSIVEASTEEERQVKGLFEAMKPLFEGIDDVTACKAIGIFVATKMVTSTKWREIIPGFMNQMDTGANAALTYHLHEEQENGSGKEGSEEASDSGPAETPS